MTDTEQSGLGHDERVGSGSPQRRFRLRNALNLLGGTLTLLALTFIAVRLVGQTGDGGALAFERQSLLLILTLAVVYAVGCRAQAQAWVEILRNLGVAHDPRLAVRIYARTQLNKYIPGNVFHFVGRQALGMAEGMPSGALARSMLWEIALLAAAAILLSLLAVPLIVSRWLPELAPVLLLSVIFFTAASIAALCLPVLTGRLRRALAWNLAFHLLAAATFIVLIASSVESGFDLTTQAMPVLGAYALAWLLGFVTPGAPAGLGIREVTLLFLLAGSVPESVLLQSLVAGRAVTIIGDVLFWIACGRGRFRARDASQD